MIYVASSWRNSMQGAVVAALRSAEMEVYDFKQPAPGNNGFHWSETGMASYDRATNSDVPVAEYLNGIEHPIAVAGFGRDFDAMRAADTCVLVLPCGRSAHLELGWFTGQGRKTVVILDDPCTPELMYRLCDFIAPTLNDLLGWFGVQPELGYEGVAPTRLLMRPERLRRGDIVDMATSAGCVGVVRRVARDGSWADVTWQQGGFYGPCWSKRQPDASLLRPEVTSRFLWALRHRRHPRTPLGMLRLLWHDFVIHPIFDGGERCGDCGRGYVLWHSPGDLWLAATGSPGGLLCPACFDRRLTRQGITVRFVAERVEPVPEETR